MTHGKEKTLAQRLAAAFVNPFTAILVCLATVSCITDMIFPHFAIAGCDPEDFDPMTVIIIMCMVFISGTLRFVQETRSGNATKSLLAMITTTCTVTRDGEVQEIPIDEVVIGDVLHLSAGDMLPADARVIEANDLFLNQAQMTGESEPAEKYPFVCEKEEPILTDFNNIAFMGTNVVSGAAKAVVVSTGDHTIFRTMAQTQAATVVFEFCIS